MIWIALLIVIGQIAIIGVVLQFVRTFGKYTKAVLDAHESNLHVHRRTIDLLAAFEAREHPQEPTIPITRNSA